VAESGVSNRRQAGLVPGDEKELEEKKKAGEGKEKS
jgi:hypothetical protein